MSLLLVRIAWFLVISIAFKPVFVGSHLLELRKRDSSCRTEDGYFLCDNSQCVERQRVRDFNDDCADRSDQRSGLNCTDDEFLCRSTFRCVPRQFVVDGCLHKRSIILGCRENQEFTCRKTRRCIPRWMVMDGERDCDTLSYNDPSDEERGFESCTSSEVRCHLPVESSLKKARCIPRAWVRDNITDCPGTGSDEVAPLSSCNNATEFRCKDSGRCVLRYRVRDGYPDCGDFSDELEQLVCNRDEFHCLDSGRCIPNTWIGNKVSDCPDGSDEKVIRQPTNCSANQYLCASSRRCIPLEYLCDGIDNCGDCSDEIESCKEQGPKMFRCPNQPSTCLSWQYSCDALTDCPNGADDITWMPGFKCQKVVLNSPTGKKYCSVPQWALHDQLPWCDDGSDICFDDRGEFLCSMCLDGKTIIAKRQLCDGIIDCPDLSDECLCSNGFNTTVLTDVCSNVCYNTDRHCAACRNCSVGHLKCDSICLARNKFCDGVVDCPISKSDELYCAKDQKLVAAKSPKNFVCDPITPLHRTLGDILQFASYAEGAALVANAVGCDGKVECLHFEDECSPRANCSTRLKVCDSIPMKKIVIPTLWSKLYNATGKEMNRMCGGFLEYVLGSSICNGVQECSEKEDETECDRFYCDAGKVLWISGTRPKISIPWLERCNGEFDCKDKTDEMNCNKSTHFYCKNGEPLFVDREKVLDGKMDCTDSSDECPEDFADKSAVSSKTEMIKSPVLRGFVWLMAILAFFGNGAVIFMTTRFIRQSRKREASSVSIINNIFVLNLAFADLLMGCCLFGLGAKSAEFSGNYCLEDLVWRASSSCSALGVSIVLSSEASVFTLILLTSYRLYGVLWPFKSRQLRVRVAAGCLAAIWAAALFIALMPLSDILSTYMVTDMLIAKSPYFKKGTVKLYELEQFALRLNALQPGNATSNLPRDWGGLVRFLSKNFPNQTTDVLGFHGYYSANGVCIPKIYRLSGDESGFNIFSAVTITFSFVSLLYILVAYVIIYRRSTQTPDIRSAADSSTRNATMQRKITFLIATDMCCWMPICIMTFLSMGGVVMPSFAYAFSAVILLPINSALNPIIYSDTLPIALGFCREQLSKFRMHTKPVVSDERSQSTKDENLHSHKTTSGV